MKTQLKSVDGGRQVARIASISRRPQTEVQPKKAGRSATKRYAEDHNNKLTKKGRNALKKAKRLNTTGRSSRKRGRN